MLQKVRWRFILTSIISLAIVLFVSMGAMILLDFHQANRESDQVMQTLVDNQGRLTPRNAKAIVGNAHDIISRNFSAGQGNPEALYQYRYFTVVNQNDGTPLHVMSHQKIYGLSDNTIKKSAQKILKSKEQQGTTELAHNRYRFSVIKLPQNQTMVIFLNTSLIYARSWYQLRIGAILVFCALIIFALILALLSRKAIKPVAVAYRKQREFITNAGHELKTPLAIISANTEMEEMLGNKSEWTESTKQQTQRLTNLINQLISMARVGETGDLVLSRVDFSAVAQDSAKSFASMMKSDHLDYQFNIQPDLHVMAEKRSLGEIVNILLDNAHKYCLPNGKVNLNLRRSKLGKSAILQVSNSFKNDKNVNFDNFFERFYREDESHNSKKSGFGIGLSMARSLVQAFRGKIEVQYADEVITFSVTLKLVK